MRYGSVCSGIESATVAWHELGWQPAFFSEIEPFPKAVLAHRWPGVPDLGDFTTIGADRGPVDLLVGGTPCQSFSVAGLRGGLADARGNLALEFLRLAARLDARWVLWENVPGVLSSNGGRDFGALLGGLAELGYGFAYRVLDAQFFGVAQRRRRVFVVGHAGGLWQRAAAVLFERACVRGDSAPSRAERADVAGSLGAGARGRGWSDDLERAGAFIPFDSTQITSALNRSAPAPGDPSHPLAAGAHPPAIAFSVKDHGADAGPIAPTLRAGGHTTSHANGGVMPAIAFHVTQDPISGEVAPAMGCGGPQGCGTIGVATPIDLRNALRADGATGVGTPGTGVGEPGEPANTLGTAALVGVAHGMAVRRLTPRECERLQGFPDDYTAIPGAKDGPRYRALGNSMAVPVMRWLGRRIEAVDRAVSAQEAA